MEQYFLANDIKEEKEKRAILQSVCGSKTYTLIWDLLQPGKPADTGLEDIPKKVGKHYSPKPSGTLQIPQPKTSARGKRVRVYRVYRVYIKERKLKFMLMQMQNRSFAKLIPYHTHSRTKLNMS